MADPAETASGKTLTRADLADAIAARVGLPRAEAAELVEAVFGQIAAALEQGEPVKLSSFGSFGVRDKNERVGRNPKTGDVVPITARRVLVFRASAIMKDKVDAGAAKRRAAKPRKARVRPVEETPPAVRKPSAAKPKAAPLIKAAKPAEDAPAAARKPAASKPKPTSKPAITAPQAAVRPRAPRRKSES